MLQTITSILGVILTVFFVIGTHEAAHFTVARLLGVKVLRFSIGFGRKIFAWRDRSGTEYMLALIPLGGYVKMLDEREAIVPVEQRGQTYNVQPFYKKALIVLAGPCMNFVCAFFLYWAILSIGFTTLKPIIGQINEHSIAAESSLRPDQEIISIDNKLTPSWNAVIFNLLIHAGDKDQLLLQTKGLYDNKIHDHTLDLSNWHIHGLLPDPLASLGLTPYEPAIPLVIGHIAPDSPAARSALREGDHLIAINHEKITGWDKVLTMIGSHPKQDVWFTVTRAGKQQHFTVAIGNKSVSWFKSTGYLGIGPEFIIPPFMLQKIKYSPIAAFIPAGAEVQRLTYFNVILFKKLLTGKVSLQTLGGPITIFEAAGESLNNGILAYFGFLAFLSISIGVLNLLPIPGLDGGHLFIHGIETLIGKPLPESVLLALYKIGLFILIFIFIQALVNDMLRLT